MSMKLSTSLVFGCLYTQDDLRLAGVDFRAGEDLSPTVGVLPLPWGEGERYILWSRIPKGYVRLHYGDEGNLEQSATSIDALTSKEDPESLSNNIHGFTSQHHLPYKVPRWWIVQDYS